MALRFLTVPKPGIAGAAQAAMTLPQAAGVNALFVALEPDFAIALMPGSTLGVRAATI